MQKPPHYTSWKANIHWLPAIDWNIKFFGAHEQQVPFDWSMPEESHFGFEIILILKGNQESIIELQQFNLSPGDIILIPPGFKHTNRCVSKNGMRYFCAHFNIDDPTFRLEMIKHDQILFPEGSDTNFKIRGIVDQWISMIRRQGGQTTADRFHLQALLFEFLGLLAHSVSLEHSKTQSQAAPTTGMYAKLIAEAMKARFNHRFRKEQDTINTSIRIDEIAASIGLTPGYCQEVFKKVYGISPRQYLSELTLHEAKTLIQQPNLSLSEIASRLGYLNLSNFSRQFKRWTGLSPLQYRQNTKPRN
ncbi:AraC family transcriptional regulator [Paenibacillus frigoriresistens]|nr:AraC family transcriptional regulator [Paenibacillus frigoriresistens]